MNTSGQEQYIKKPYLIPISKYWLQFGKSLTDKNNIFSQQQISFIMEFIENDNDILELFNYIITKLTNEENIETRKDLLEQFDRELFEIILILDKLVFELNYIYELEKMDDTIYYQLFYKLAQFNITSTEQKTKKDNNSNFIVSPYFNSIYRNYLINRNWFLSASNITPCNISLKTKKELNYLLFNNDNKKFRFYETQLNSSKQLYYMKKRNTDKPVQEITSYINRVDTSLYGENIDYQFNPKYIPTFKNKNNNNLKKSNDFNPKLYLSKNNNMNGISSSNLLSLQIVESLYHGPKDYKKTDILTNSDIISDLKKRNGIINNTSTQLLNGYSNPPDNKSIINSDKTINVEPKFYNQVSLKRIYH